MISFFKKIFKDNEARRSAPKGPLKLNQNNYMSLLYKFQEYSREDVINNLSSLVEDKMYLEEIYWFVPKIIFDITFPEVKNMESDKYTILDKNGKAKAYSFSNNKTYQELKYWLEKYKLHIPNDLIGDILNHSSEFDMLQHSLSLGLKPNQSIVASVYTTSKQ